MWRLREYSSTSAVIRPPMSRSVVFQSPARSVPSVVVFGVHVVGDGERKRDVDRGDDVVGRRRQARIKIVLAQPVEHEQHEGDRHQRHRQQRRPAFAGPEIDEEIEEEEDRDGVIDALDNETRPVAGRCLSWRARLDEFKRRAPNGARPVLMGVRSSR